MPILQKHCLCIGNIGKYIAKYFLEISEQYCQNINNRQIILNIGQYKVKKYILPRSYLTTRDEFKRYFVLLKIRTKPILSFD